MISDSAKIVDESDKIIPGGTFKSERLFLHFFCKNKIVLEIGCFAGQTTICIADSCKKLYCVDVWDNIELIKNAVSREHYEKKKNELVSGSIFFEFFNNVKRFKNVVIINATSEEASKIFPKNFFDVIFIDGDHSYEGVKEDITNYEDKVKVGGFLLFHDTTNEYWSEGILKAINDALPNRFVERKGFMSIKVFERLE